MLENKTLTPDIEPEEDEYQPSGLEKLRSYVGKLNIADDMDEDTLGSLGQKVMQEYQIDKESMGMWLEKHKDAMKLAMQEKEEKTFPWQGASNVKYPLVTVAAIQFNARTYPAIVGDQRVVKGKVNGDDSGMYEVATDELGQPVIDSQTGEPQAQMIKPPGYKQEKADRISTHMSWQLTEEMEEWEEELDRLLMSLPIVGVIFKKTYFNPVKGRNVSLAVMPENLIINYKAKTLETAPRVTERVFLYPYEYEEKVRSGLYRRIENFNAESEEDPDAPMEFIEQHRREDLDEDGYAEPYIVLVHKDSGEVVRVTACFDEDDIYASEDGGVALVNRHEYYTKFGFIPNPESGIYDLGFGTLLHSISSSVNTMLNQMIDAGTLQNAGGGFMGDGIKVRGGPLRFKVGEYKRVDVTGGKIADNIYSVPHAGPSPTLFQLLGFMVEAARDISSTKDILTGEQAAANVPATTTLALIEQGLKSYTAIFKRIHRSLQKELKKLFDLNRKYLDEKQYYMFLDEQGVAAREDYSDEEMDITPATDPNIVTDMQQTARANFLLQFAADPFFNGKEIRRRVLAAAKIEAIDDVLVDPPQPPPPPPDPALIKAGSEAQIALMKEQRERINDLVSNLKKIAETEEIEAGSQLGIYLRQLEEITNAEEAAAQAGGSGGVESEPGVGALPALPVGLEGVGGGQGQPIPGTQIP